MSYIAEWWNQQGAVGRTLLGLGQTILELRRAADVLKAQQERELMAAQIKNRELQAQLGLIQARTAYQEALAKVAEARKLTEEARAGVTTERQQTEVSRRELMAAETESRIKSREELTRARVTGIQEGTETERTRRALMAEESRARVERGRALTEARIATETARRRSIEQLTEERAKVEQERQAQVEAMTKRIEQATADDVLSAGLKRQLIEERIKSEQQDRALNEELRRQQLEISRRREETERARKARIDAEINNLNKLAETKRIGQELANDLVYSRLQTESLRQAALTAREEDRIEYEEARRRLVEASIARIRKAIDQNEISAELGQQLIKERIETERETREQLKQTAEERRNIDRLRQTTEDARRRRLDEEIESIRAKREAGQISDQLAQDMIRERIANAEAQRRLLDLHYTQALESAEYRRDVGDLRKELLQQRIQTEAARRGEIERRLATVQDAARSGQLTAKDKIDLLAKIASFKLQVARASRGQSVSQLVSDLLNSTLLGKLDPSLNSIATQLKERALKDTSVDSEWFKEAYKAIEDYEAAVLSLLDQDAEVETGAGAGVETPSAPPTAQAPVAEPAPGTAPYPTLEQAAGTAPVPEQAAGRARPSIPARISLPDGTTLDVPPSFNFENRMSDQPTSSFLLRLAEIVSSLQRQGRVAEVERIRREVLPSLGIPVPHAK